MKRLLVTLTLVVVGALLCVTRVSVAGINQWTAAGLADKYVVDVAVDPWSPSTVYAATFTDGVFKSTDGGATWNSANDGLRGCLFMPDTQCNVDQDCPPGQTCVIQAQQMNRLVIDPTTPAVLYFVGLGSFKSTDGGQSWTSMSGLYTGDSAFAIDPQTPSTLYASITGQGIFKSSDGGANWSPSSTGLTSLYVQALTINPVTPTTLYAGTNGAGTFKSTNAGANWVASNAGLTSMNVTALAVDPVNPSTLYAGTGGAGARLFKSTNGGASWTALNTGNVYVGGEAQSFVVDPRRPSRLYAVTGGSEVAGVVRSTDGGMNWTDITIGLYSPSGVSLDALALGSSGSDLVDPSVLYAAATYSGVLKLEIVPCRTDGDCTDSDACTVDTCSPNAPGTDIAGCLHTAITCDDGNPCTYDYCDSATGACSNGPACDDGDACTDDLCDTATGECSYRATSCDDGDPCSLDSCDSAAGCVHALPPGFEGAACELDHARSASYCQEEPIPRTLRKAISKKLANALRLTQKASRNHNERKVQKLLRAADRSLTILLGQTASAAARAKISQVCAASIESRIRDLRALIADLP